MKLLPLNKGKFAQVDDDDFEYLNQWKWFFKEDGNVYYVLRGETIRYKKQKQYFLHREILKLTDSKIIVDHIDHDGLNCQKSNLRVCTTAQNAWNQRKRKGVTSKYKGVSWCKNAEKWRAYIGFNNKVIHLGWFKTEIEAAVAYNNVVESYYGEFAVFNKIIIENE